MFIISLMILKMMSLSLIGVYGAISTALFLPDFSSIQSEFGLNLDVFHISLSIYLGGSALGNLFLGAFSDKVGRIKALLFGQLMFVFSVFFIIFAKSHLVILILRFFQGVGGAVGVVLANAMCKDLFQGKELFRAVALIFMSMTLAPIFAPILGDFIRNFHSWRGNFIFLGCFCLVSIVFSLLFLKNDPKISKGNSSKTILDIFKGYADLITNNNSLVLLFLAFIFSSSCFFLFISMANKIFLNYFMLSVSEFSLILSLTAFSSFLGMFSFRSLIKKFYINKLGKLFFNFGIISSALNIIALVFFNSFVVYLFLLCCYLSATAAIAVIFISEALNQGEKYSTGHLSALFGFLQLTTGAGVSFLCYILKLKEVEVTLLFFILISVSFFFYLKYLKSKSKLVV